MNQITPWLPDLVYFEDCNGQWEKYLEVIYQYFFKDFIVEPPIYEGNKIRIVMNPKFDGKEATFWHIISEGKIEDDRTPELRRCERIRWPRPIIEHCFESDIKIWENRRGRDIRVCIMLDSANYIVILVKRKQQHFLLTAYPITRTHNKRKLIKEYEAYIKANAA